jgi:multidrug efflux pump subunit AcrA (membrane-fusion protein)
MKKNLKNNSIILAIVALLTLASCGAGSDHADHADTYTCPMHSTVVSDRPGTCPVCGMDLVRKARPGEEVEITEDLGKLIQSPNETVIASIKTIKAEYKSVPSSVQAQGVVTYDTRNIFTIPSRVGGRLEKVYLKYAYQPVVKGQKIAEIYSPELLTAQRELLFLVENDAENKSLIDAAKNKINLLGLTPAQIDDLIARKTATQTFSIYSPYAGYLITGQPTPTTSAYISSASTTSSGSMSDGMGSSPSGSSSGASTGPLTDQNGLIVREGAYVSAGETLFSIVNTGDLRIELDLPASQAGAIKKGDKLFLDFGNGSTEETTIAFIQPFFSDGQDFLKLRVFTNKTNDLHIGHLVSAKIQVPASESLWVPREAVLDLGADKIVFIKEHGVLKPRKVVIGISSEGLVEIKSGLASSDEIAANAQYLIDSESFIKTEK